MPEWLSVLWLAGTVASSWMISLGLRTLGRGTLSGPWETAPQPERSIPWVQRGEGGSNPLEQH